MQIKYRFIDHYKTYSHLKEGFENSKNDDNFGFYRPFKKDEKIKRGDIVERNGTLYLFKGRCFIGGRQGYCIDKDKKRIKDFEDSCLCGETLVPSKKCFYRSNSFKSSDYLIFDEEVLNYLIDLPQEHHNPHVDVFLFKNKGVDGISDFLVKEYCKGGKRFEKHFLDLSLKDQRKVTSKIRSIDTGIHHIDYFLWKQGFKIRSLDHLTLYKESSEDFIKYFKSRKNEEKKSIIAELFACKDENEQVIKWLNDKYPKLIRDVGLDINR